MKDYQVKLVRIEGYELNNYIERAEETLTIQANSAQEAHEKAQVRTSLSFRGQEMKVYINGKLHLNKKF